MPRLLSSNLSNTLSKTLSSSLVALLLFAGASSIANAQSIEEGKSLFENNCAVCHNPGATGHVMLGKRLGEDNALLAERKNLTAEYIDVVLRYGVGSMPWYRKTEISDKEAAAIAAFLTRNNPSQ